MNKQLGFDEGVLWAAARLVEFHDQPTLAKELLTQSGADLSKVTALDTPFIQQALGITKKVRVITAPPGLIEAGQKVTREAAEAAGGDDE